MTFWWLAKKDLLIVFRDKKALLTLVVMPLLLIAILGSAFGNLMKEEADVTIQKFTLGIANLDEGQLSKVLTKEVMEKELANQIQVNYYQEEDLYQKVKDHKLAVGLVLEADFSSSLMSGNQAKVKLITIPDPGIKATIVTTVIEQFAQSVAINAAAANMSQPVQAGNQQSNVSEEPQINQPLLKETTIDAKTKPVGSFQYYAAAMGVMFLLMTVVQGVSTMILEKEQEVYKRLLLSNLTFTNYLFGKMLGLIIICSAQAFLIIMGTRFLFGVAWGTSISGIVMMTFAFVINACGLGILAGSFIKTEKTFNTAGMFATQILAALGGSMAPLYIFPDWIIRVGKLLPNGLALQTYLELMSGASFYKIYPAIVGSLGLGIFYLAIGLVRLSIERRRRYA